MDGGVNSDATGEIRVGTCGWTDPTLTRSDAFYPKRTMSAEERLRFYAERFPIVEVDATYYAPPTEEGAVKWMERTPSRFLFNVKAYSLFTNHPTRVAAMWPDLRAALPDELVGKPTIYRNQLPPELLDESWDRFAYALMPLHSAGKLGAALFQFPHWFVIGAEAKDYLVECSERLPDYRVAVEFRNHLWMDERNRDETLAFLTDHDLPLVCVDMPQGLKESIPPIAEATTTDLALVRFHGRDATAFSATGVSAAERFRYDYAESELAEWVPKIQTLAARARQTHVLMNNCYGDQAVRAARVIEGLLDLDGGADTDPTSPG
jgi:uncharacterized protein YecE (DUF72 family)